MERWSEEEGRANPGILGTWNWRPPPYLADSSSKTAVVSLYSGFDIIPRVKYPSDTYATKFAVAEASIVQNVVALGAVMEVHIRTRGFEKAPPQANAIEGPCSPTLHPPRHAAAFLLVPLYYWRNGCNLS